MTTKDNEIKCPQCGHNITGTGVDYCPECGTPNIPKPHVGTGTKIGLIIALILVFPIGLIATLATFWGYKKEMDRWKEATHQI